jgi:peroxiredoxin
VYGISLDSPWSHRAWAEALVLDGMPLLSDALGEAAAAFGVLSDSQGVPKANRSVFLVRDGRVEASWLLDAPAPDVDAILAVARA